MRPLIGSAPAPNDSSSSEPETAALPALFAEVAVPLPLSGPLTYELPPEFAAITCRGVRVRVPVGRRQLTGLVLRVHSEEPQGITLRRLVTVIDSEPVVPEDLLTLAEFTSRYYLAPMGEVVRSILPAELPP